MGKDKPINGRLYNLFGDDCWGDFTIQARCVHYKCVKSLTKNQKRYGYRWIAKDGSIIRHDEIERFEIILENAL